MNAPMIVTKCATCPITSGCGGNPYAAGRCLRGDDLAEMYVMRAALKKIADYSPASTIQPVLIARAALKGEVW